jgi:hypothetical protein
MRISKQEEIVFRDLDDLKSALTELDVPLIEGMNSYFLGRKPGKIFRTYIKSRKGLTKLLKKDKWKNEDVAESLKRGIKLYAARDYLDTLLENKEKVLEMYVNHVLEFCPQLVDLSRKRLVETERRLMHNPSYITRIKNKLTRKEIESSEEPDPILTLKVVLYHPVDRYFSHAGKLTVNENLNANKIVKIMNNCRKNVLKKLKMLVEKEFYKNITRTYNELNGLIKYTDKQEKFETGAMNDLILLDSLLKNLCTHTPPHYEDVKTPKEFLYKLLTCPNVKMLLNSSKQIQSRTKLYQN